MSFQRLSEGCRVMRQIFPRRSPAGRMLPRFSPGDAPARGSSETQAGTAVGTLSDCLGRAGDRASRGRCATALRGARASPSAGRVDEQDVTADTCILSSATPLTSPGGHPYAFGGEVADEDAIRDMVRRNADRGADVIKIMGTGGGMTKDGPAIWQNQFTEHQLRITVEEAGRHGLPVAVHAPRPGQRWCRLGHCSRPHRHKAIAGLGQSLSGLRASPAASSTPAARSAEPWPSPSSLP